MYGLKYNGRAISSVSARRDASSQWLVGTTALREENEVHLLEQEENSEHLTCKGVYSHAGEMWDMASSPAHEGLFFTVYSAGGSYDAALWEMVDGKLEAKFKTDGKQKNARKILWSPDAESDVVALASKDRINLWNLSADGGSISSSTSPGELDNILSIAWNHLNHNLVCASCSESLRCIDLRTMGQTITIDKAHEMAVRDVDFSKTNQNLVATGGDDCSMCVWDLRKAASPVVRVSNHSHWVWQARFNPYHEALIVTSSSDSLVQLWHLEEDEDNGSEIK